MGLLDPQVPGLQTNSSGILTGPDEMAQLQNATDSYNKLMGTSMTAQQYDQAHNPDSAWARWGLPDPNAGTTPATGTTATPSTTQAATPQVSAPQASAPAGLINTDNLGYTATTATAAPQTPVSSWNVTAPQTVAGQVAGLIASDSPLMQTARTQSNQVANDHGLLNSSMANQAGEQAVINEALPIATQDAQTNAQSAQFNAGSQNTSNLQTQQLGTSVNLANAQSTDAAGEFTAGQKLTAQATDAAAKNQLQLTNLDDAFKASIANADMANKVQLQQMQGATQTQLASIEADYKTLMQTSSTVGTMYQSTMANIAAAVSDPNMDPTSKASAINGYLSDFKTVANTVGSINGVDVTSLLSFPEVTAT